MRFDLKAAVLLSILYTHAAVASFFPVNGGMVNQASVITAAAGTTTLVATSNQIQVVEGATTQTIVLPDATLLPLSWFYEITNNSTGSVTVKDGSGATLATLTRDSFGKFTMTARASAAGTWKSIVLAGINGGSNIYGNAATATALAANPTDCSAGLYATAIDASGNLTCSALAGAGTGDVVGPSSATDNAIARYDTGTGKLLQNSGATIDDSGNVTATSFIGPVTGDVTGDVTGNADTATALAANPSDCASDTYATTIAASGNLTCASITNASTTASASAGNSTIVLRDGSGNFAAGTITAALSGNASTSSALAANPSDCSANQFANAIAANGNLTCAQPAFSDFSALTASRVLLSDASGFVSASSVTSTTLGYLDATSSIQTQLDAKADLAGDTFTGLVTLDEVKETVVAGGTCSTSYAVNPTSGSMFTLTLSGACELQVTSLAAGHSFTIFLTQSSTTAPTFSTAYDWQSGTTPTFSTSATKYDTISCASPDGTKLICGALIDNR